MLSGKGTYRVQGARSGSCSVVRGHIEYKGPGVGHALW